MSTLALFVILSNRWCGVKKNGELCNCNGVEYLLEREEDAYAFQRAYPLLYKGRIQVRVLRVDPSLIESLNKAGELMPLAKMLRVGSELSIVGLIAPLWLVALFPILPWDQWRFWTSPFYWGLFVPAFFVPLVLCLYAEYGRRQLLRIAGIDVSRGGVDTLQTSTTCPRVLLVPHEWKR